MKRDPTDPRDDGVTYIECLLLGQLDACQRGTTIGRALITPMLAAERGLDDMERLRLYAALIAFMLGMAENSIGPEGRDAIVQTMRNVPASRDLLRQH